MPDRFRFFAPDHLADELRRPDADPGAARGRAGMGPAGRTGPAVADVVRAVHARPEPLAAAPARTPSTFLHGDPNLGLAADGRAADWAYPGAGPAAWEPGWYLALDAARLPESKQDAIDR